MGNQVPPPSASANQSVVAAKKPIYKKVWFWVLVVIVIGVIGAMGGAGSDKAGDSSADSTAAQSSSSSASAGDASAAPTEAQSSQAPAEQTQEPAAEPPLEVPAQTIVAAYQNNELGADQQYKGKLVKISGVMDSVSEVLGIKSLVIGTGEQFSFNGVSCPLKEDAEIQKAAGLSKGANVTVIGTVTGFDQINVDLKDCTIQ